MDEVQKLIVQVENAAKIAELTDLLKAQRTTLTELIALSKQGPLTPAQAQTMSTVAKAAVDTGKELAALEKTTRNLGMAGLEAGRILQDFAQGGIGGILNNVEGAARALGGGPGLAGLLTAISVAAYTATPLIKAFWASVVKGATEDVPKARDRVKELSKELEEQGKALKDLEEQHKLTTAQLQEYNSRLAASADLEKKAADAKKTRMAIETARDSQTDEQKAIAGDVQGLMGNNPDAYIKAARDAMRKDADQNGQLGARRKELARRIQALQKEIASDPLNLVGMHGKLTRDIEDQRGFVQEESDRIDKQAEDLVGKSLRGDPNALRELVKNLPQGRMRDDLSTLTPEARKQQEQEAKDTEDFGQRAHDAGAARRDYNRRWKKTAKSMDDRTEHDADVAQQREDDIQAKVKEARDFSNATVKARNQRRAAVRPMIDVNAPIETQRAQMAEAGAINGSAPAAPPRNAPDIEATINQLEDALSAGQNNGASNAYLLSIDRKLQSLYRRLNHSQAQGQRGYYPPIPEMY